MARLAFAFRMAKERWYKERSLCPYCESLFATRLQRKWLFIEARKCLHCGLIFRWPTDPAAGAVDFYADGYEGQQATDLPNGAALEQMTARNFASTPFDKRERVAFLNGTIGAVRDRRLLDYGCSWGYSVWQYRAAGWSTSGFEFDKRRANFGREHLNLDIRANLEEFRDDRFDLIVADHSLEHVARPGTTLDTLTRLANDTASLVIFVPNGGCLEARRRGVGWGPLIGESHTIAFTIDWFARNLARHGWNAAFFKSSGESLPQGEYLDNQGEICVIAQRSPMNRN